MIEAQGLQELPRKKDTFLYMCLIDFTEACDSADRTLLKTVLALVGGPLTMVVLIRLFHNGMRALCVAE